MAKKRLRTSKLLIGVILLGMITMRLAWIENRTYPSIFGASPWFELSAADRQLPLTFYCGYSSGDLTGLGLEPFRSRLAFALICSTSAGSDAPSPAPFAQAPQTFTPAQAPLAESLSAWEQALKAAVTDTNTALMILTALMAGFVARLIGRSWLLASAIVAMLLSRGRWLSGLGQVSDYYIWGFILSFWLVLSCYFFKTASRYPFAAAWLFLMAAGLSFPETHLLIIALAAVWLAVFLSPDRGEVGPPSPIRLLGAVDLPVGQAVAVHRRQLLPLAAAGALGLALSLGLYLKGLPPAQVWHWWDLRVVILWFQQLYRPVDIDLSLAMAGMVIALILPSPRRYPLLKVAIALVFTALMVIIAASGWWTLATAHPARPSYFDVLLKPSFILPVFEPLLLVVGGLSLALLAARLYDFLTTVPRTSPQRDEGYRADTP